jgi:hypothetical protein
MSQRNHGATWVMCLVMAAALIGAGGAAAQSKAAPMPLALGEGSTLWLEGTSSLHDFESRTSEVTLNFARDAAAREPADAAGFEALIRTTGIVGLDVDVPVASMRSGKSGLDHNLQHTLHADKFPNIHFHLQRYTLAPAITGRDTVDLQAEGSLTVAGKERPETLLARAYRGGQGVWLEGSQALRMTDFDIRPPTMMLGTLRVGDRITVHYRLLLEPRGALGSAPAKGASAEGGHQ